MTWRRARPRVSAWWLILIVPVALVVAATVWAVNNAYRIG